MLCLDTCILYSYVHYVFRKKVGHYHDHLFISYYHLSQNLIILFLTAGHITYRYSTSPVTTLLILLYGMFFRLLMSSILLFQSMVLLLIQYYHCACNANVKCVAFQGVCVCHTVCDTVRSYSGKLSQIGRKGVFHIEIFAAC